MKDNGKHLTGKVIKRSILLLVIILAGIILYYVFNPKKAVNLIFPDLNEITYANAVIKNDSAHIKFSMVFQNKNPYKLDIDTLHFKVSLADTVIANQTIALMLKQTSFDIDTTEVPLNLNIKKIRTLIKGLQGKDSTDIKINGYAVYETIFGIARLKINKKTRIRVPIPPEIKVLTVERKHFNLREKTLKANAVIEIINKGKTIDIQITDVHYNMTVKNTLHSDGVISKPITIKPQSSVKLNIPIEVKIFHPLKTAWLVTINKDKLNYSLHATFNIKENISKMPYESPAEISATGVIELVK